MNYRYKCRCAPPRKLLVVHHRTPPPLTFDQFQVLDQFDIFDQFDVLDHTRAKQPLRPAPLPRERAGRRHVQSQLRREAGRGWGHDPLTGGRGGRWVGGVSEQGGGRGAPWRGRC